MAQLDSLPDAVEDICEEWGLIENNLPICDFIPARSVDLINGQEQLFEASNTKFGLVSILSSGDIYRIKIKTIKTGDITWNGDDEYFQNFRIKITPLQYVGTIENLQKTNPQTIEQIACEIVTTLYQK